jgi:hypothetical protein
MSLGEGKQAHDKQSRQNTSGYEILHHADAAPLMMPRQTFHILPCSEPAADLGEPGTSLERQNRNSLYPTQSIGLLIQ